jgi:hypothetical protein
VTAAGRQSDCSDRGGLPRAGNRVKQQLFAIISQRARALDEFRATPPRPVTRGGGIYDGSEDALARW